MTQSSYITSLVIDQSGNSSPRQTPGFAGALVNCIKPTHPKLLIFNKELASELGLTIQDEKELISFISGTHSSYQDKSFAMCYGGHQFGHWAGQLGDGRAINLLEFNQNGLINNLQLKGAGPTPYSRTADGYAVLRSSIREYLCSEAMHHLGVPTTRALSLALSGDQVMRDMLYDGHPKLELGAIVGRVAPTFVRFGNFEIHAARGESTLLVQLLDYTITNYYSHLKETENPYLSLLEEVFKRTIDMVVHWYRVGFVHGVMNTDNMSILGQTIDYGPYGWVDNYDLQWTPNTTDRAERRYRFGNQANIAFWNLVKLANAFYSFIKDEAIVKELFDKYQLYLSEQYYSMQAKKLGLYKGGITYKSLIDELAKLMQAHEIDMTIFFREISYLTIDKQTIAADFDSLLSKSSYLENNNQVSFTSWIEDYINAVRSEGEVGSIRKTRMLAFNPKYILRNYMTQMAIEKAEQKDYSLMNELNQLIVNPYNEQPDFNHWYARRPDWARNKIGSSMLSCSS